MCKKGEVETPVIKRESGNFRLGMPKRRRWLTRVYVGSEYRSMSVCTGFVLDIVATFSRVLTLGTNEVVATSPSEKPVHADPIRYVSLCLFYVPDMLSLFTLSLNNIYI